MSFSVYRTISRNRLTGHFDTLEEALAQLARHSLLVLPADAALTAPVPITVERVTIDVATPGTALHFGADVRNATIIGALAVVTTSAAIMRVVSPEATLILRGGAGRDVVTAGLGEDNLFGGDGADILYGGAAGDLLVGGAGRDKLFGGDGDDILLAGTGRDWMTGGAGADAFHVTLTAGQTDSITDFSPGDGDRLYLSGADAPADWQDFLDTARVIERTNDTVIRIGDARIQMTGAAAADFTKDAVRFGTPETLAFDTFADFAASGLMTEVNAIQIGAATYRLRDGEPLHEEYKYQDDTGRWWSPDYFVVAAGGQSNMLGVGDGGDRTLSGNVTTWDHVNDALIDADYAAAPAGGTSVRVGTALKNNLFFPFAERIAEEMERPVMVIAHPVNGSRLESWLAHQEGSNWGALVHDINQGLAAIGQSHVDSFIWHQGEADTRMATEDYVNDFRSLVAQVRAMGWGGDDLAFIAGELSRAGSNAAQNVALQLVELANTDANLRFASSVGLTSSETTGVHFDGASLVEFGAERFWAALSDALNGAPVHSANAAPIIASGAPGPMSITIVEGQVLTLDTATWFSDADADTLYTYGFLDQRGATILDGASDGSSMKLMPDYDADGEYILSVYASDGEFDSAAIDINLTVIDATATATAYTGADFGHEMGQYRDAASAMADLSANRGLDILDQSALAPVGPIIVTTESLTLRGDAGIRGSMLLADGLLRLYSAGDAAFDLTGNAANNTLNGNDADNAIAGLAGNDRISGGAGDDSIDAGSGTDYVWGGAGADRFAFHAGSDQLQLRDFASGTDTIEISGFSGIDDFADLLSNAVIRTSQARTIVDIGSDQLVLSDTAPTDLTADDFLFL